MTKVGKLKVKGLSFLLSFALFFFLCCLVCFLFVVWLCRFGYGMDEVMMY